MNRKHHHHKRWNHFGFNNSGDKRNKNSFQASPYSWPNSGWDTDEVYRYVRNYSNMSSRRSYDEAPNNYDRFQSEVDVLDHRDYSQW